MLSKAMISETDFLRRVIYLKRQAIHLLIEEIEVLRSKNLKLEDRVKNLSKQSQE